MRPDEVAGWYLLHGQAVFHHVRRMVGPTTAADVTHDVFVSLMRGHPHVDPAKGSIVALLVRMGHCRAIDVIRRNEAARRRDTLDANQPSFLHFDDVAAAAVRGAVTARVTAALESLEPAVRQPLLLAFYSRLTHREIAIQLGVPEGTVKSRIRRGLHQLRQNLQDDSS